MTKIGISIGDINGIGLEVIFKTFADERMLEFCTPVIYGSSKIASYHRKALDISNFNYNVIKNVEAANSKRTNIVNCWDENVKIELGRSSSVAGSYALKSLEAAIKDLKNNQLDALVTAPINKDNIQSKDFHFPGHTEYLAKKFEAPVTLMLMVSNDLKVGVVTDHIPLSEVPLTLSRSEERRVGKECRSGWSPYH